jgi:hypothetical protein
MTLIVALWDCLLLLLLLLLLPAPHANSWVFTRPCGDWPVHCGSTTPPASVHAAGLALGWPWLAAASCWYVT